MKTLLRILILLLFCIPGLLKAQCPVINFGPDTLICNGSSITLDAGNPGATYEWSDGSSAPQLTTFFENEYWVKVTLNGCTVSDTIYVQHGPVIYADFNYLQTTSCSPLIVEFSSYAQACSNTITGWSWNFGDGNTSSQKDPQHSYDAPGIYSVQLTVTSASGASYTAQQSVTVAGNISPAVELGNDISLCQGNQVTLNATNAGATYLWSNGATSPTIDVFTSGKYWVRVIGNSCTVSDTVNVTVVPILWNDFAFTKVADCSPVKYQFTDRSRTCTGSIIAWYWEFGDGTTSTQQNPEHSYYTSGQYNVRLTITDDQGNTSRRTRRVTVVVTSFNINIGADTTICLGNSITLDAAHTGATYLWNTGATSSSIIANAAGSYSVQVTSNGCTISDTLRISTSASVSAKFGYNISGACLPVAVQFSDSTEAYCGQQITRWQWDFGDGSISTEQNPVHNYSSADSFDVRLTTTVSNGAQSTRVMRIGISNTDYSLNLTDRILVCREDSFTVNAGVPNAEYNWTPASAFGNPQAMNARGRATTNGWYKVTTTRCMISKTDSVFVVLDSVQKPQIVQQANTLRVRNASAYAWYFGSQRIAGANSSSIRIDRSGYYSSRVYNQNGCSAVSDSVFFMPVSRLNSDTIPVMVRATPNPTNGPFNVVLSEVPAKPIKLVLYDRYGRVLLVKYTNQHVTPLQAPNLSRGMYFLEANINNKKIIVPVVVQ
jgi:PKD repeat protein